LTWLVVAFVTALTALIATVGADAHWLAALGGAIVRAGSVLDTVPYAAAPTAAWENVPALGELVFHGLEAALGDRGLVLAQVLAVGLALSLLAIDMRRAGAADSPSALVLLLVAVATAPALLIVRGQLFSLALFPVLILLLRREARLPSARIWLVVPLVALWSNLHGGVLLALAVTGSYLVFSRLRRQPLVTVCVLAASGAALFATPSLLKTGDYYRGVLGSEAARSGEGLWAPLSPSRPFDLIFIVLAVPLLFAALRSRPALWELVALVGLAAGTVHTGRNSVWLALFAATPAALGVTGAREWRLVPPRVATLAASGLCAALLVVGLVRTPASESAGAALRRQASEAAAGQPVLADDINAESLALDGQVVWIANPLDAFERADQRLYLDWIAGRPAGDIQLANMRAVLVTRDSPAQRRLARAAVYREQARDRRAVLYVRKRVQPVAASVSGASVSFRTSSP
jgi:hypothetical protein